MAEVAAAGAGSPTGDGLLIWTGTRWVVWAEYDRPGGATCWVQLTDQPVLGWEMDAWRRQLASEATAAGRVMEYQIHEDREGHRPSEPAHRTPAP